MTNIIEFSPFQKKFYKYRPFDIWSIRLLQTGMPYFSSPQKLNDPSDCLPYTINDLQSIKDCQRVMQALNIQIEFDEEIEYTEEQRRNYYGYIIEKECIKILRNSTAIFSLSSDPHIPLMWSHYADQNMGICIEFTADVYLEGYDENEIRPVDYCKQRVVPLSKLFEDAINNSVNSQFKNEIFYKKADWWFYENEYRIVKNGINVEGEHSVPNFPITAVYFGLKSSQETIEIVDDLVNMSDIKLFKVAYKNNGTFDMCSYRTYVKRPNRR